MDRSIIFAKLQLNEGSRSTAAKTMNFTIEYVRQVFY
jgi:hypothetical protein